MIILQKIGMALTPNDPPQPKGYPTPPLPKGVSLVACRGFEL